MCFFLFILDNGEQSLYLKVFKKKFSYPEYLKLFLRPPLLQRMYESLPVPSDLYSKALASLKGVGVIVVFGTRLKNYDDSAGLEILGMERPPLL